jgi:hypothetical protein
MNDCRVTLAQTFLFVALNRVCTSQVGHTADDDRSNITVLAVFHLVPLSPSCTPERVSYEQ